MRMAEIRKLKNYINGEWVESKTDQYEDVVNPATKRSDVPGSDFYTGGCGIRRPLSVRSV